MLVPQFSQIKFDNTALLTELCYVMSNHLPWLFFGLALPLLNPGTINLSHLLIGRSSHLLFTCPNHLGLSSLILSTTQINSTLPRITMFLIPSPSMPTHPSVHPHLHYLHLLNVGVLDRLLLCTYYNAGLTTTLQST